MERTRIGLLAARALQFLAAIVILGLSIRLVLDFNHASNLCKQYNGLKGYGDEKKACRKTIASWPSTLRFLVFVGVLGLVDALVGIVAIFMTALRVEIALLIDALAAIFYLIGAILLIIRYKLIDHNYQEVGKSSIAKSIKADIAFCFIGLIATLAAMAPAFLARRSNRPRTSAPAASSPIRMSAV